MRNIKTLALLTTLLASAAFAQSDSVIVPSEFRFAPSVRTVAAEASAFAFVYGSYGVTVDVDLFELPFATVQGAGIRLNYQEYRRGYIPSFNNYELPFAYVTSAFLRASFKKGNSRSDVVLGIVSKEPHTSTEKRQIHFGIEVSALIIKPLSSLFVRINGKPGGASAQFGIAIGYID